MSILKPDTAIDSLVRCLQRDGYVVVERLAPELVARAKEQLEPHIAATPFGPGNSHGAFTKDVEGLVGKSDAAHKLMIHDTVLAVCNQILLPNCVRYQLNYTGVMHLEPGAKNQELLRDGEMYPFRHPHPPTQLAVMWAANEFTATNGGTRVVPGSHLWEHARAVRDHEVISVTMPPGSLLLYLAGVIHGGGSNTSNVARTGIAVQYSLGWLRQEENLHIAVPPILAKTLPDVLARLVGYDLGGPFTGFVHGDDPHRLLEDAPIADRCHSYPELDTASARLPRLRWGDITPVPTPE